MGTDQAERVRGFVFGVEQSTVVDGVELGPSGQIRLLSGGKPIPLTDVRSSEWRKSGETLKAKSAAFTGNSAFIDPEAALASSAYVFGIDTNTVERGDTKLNVSCLTCATRQFPTPDYKGAIEQILCVDFRDSEYKAERIGWIIAIEAAIRSGVKLDETVSIFTDHDLGALGRINSRTEPIIPGYYLPQNVNLMYATDRGSAVPNKLIKAAHKGASQVAEKVLAVGREGQMVLPFLLRQPGAEPIRPWINERNAAQFFGH